MKPMAKIDVEVDGALVSQLNSVLKNKLTAINQYFLHARMTKHMGYMKLADHEYKESIQQMKHADLLVERVLALGGTPNLSDLGQLHIGQDIEGILRCDLKLEESFTTEATAALKLCVSRNDSISADILNKILENKKEQVAFLSAQLNLIDTTGLPKYLQSQL